jgi:hypothetical protein
VDEYKTSVWAYLLPKDRLATGAAKETEEVIAYIGGFIYWAYSIARQVKQDVKTLRPKQNEILKFLPGKKKPPLKPIRVPITLPSSTHSVKSAAANKSRESTPRPLAVAAQKTPSSTHPTGKIGTGQQSKKQGASVGRTSTQGSESLPVQDKCDTPLLTNMAPQGAQSNHDESTISAGKVVSFCFCVNDIVHARRKHEIVLQMATWMMIWYMMAMSTYHWMVYLQLPTMTKTPMMQQMTLMMWTWTMKRSRLDLAYNLPQSANEAKVTVRTQQGRG